MVEPTDPAIIETETPLTEAEREEHDRATKPVEEAPEEQDRLTKDSKVLARVIVGDHKGALIGQIVAAVAGKGTEGAAQYAKEVAEAASAVDAANLPEAEKGEVSGFAFSEETEIDASGPDIPAIDLELSGYQRAIEALDNFDRALTIIPFRRRDRALLQVLEAWRAAKPEVLARLERVKQRRK